MHAGKWGGGIGLVHGVHTSREGSSGMGPSGRFGPFPCDDSNGRRGGVPGTRHPPLCWLEGGYWVWAVRAAAWYFRHTQADPLLAASAAWASRRRLSLLPAPSLEKNNGRLLLGNPLHPTSNGKHCTFHPLVSHSCTRSKYFDLLYS